MNITIGTTGLDYPALGCITDATPSKSLTRQMQKWGRGTRTLPGVIDGIEDATLRKNAIKSSNKSKCIILDIVDNTTKHRLINTWSLDKELPVEKRIFTTSEKKEKLIEAREKRKFEGVTKKDTRIDLLQLPKVKLSTSLKMKDPATEKQLSYLQKLGFNTNEVSYTKAMANELISFAPATEAQINYLKWKKFDCSKGVTRAEAAAAFEMLKEQDYKNKMNSEVKNSPISDVF